MAGGTGRRLRSAWPGCRSRHRPPRSTTRRTCVRPLSRRDASVGGARVAGPEAHEHARAVAQDLRRLIGYGCRATLMHTAPAQDGDGAAVLSASDVRAFRRPRSITSTPTEPRRRSATGSARRRARLVGNAVGACACRDRLDRSSAGRGGAVEAIFRSSPCAGVASPTIISIIPGGTPPSGAAPIEEARHPSGVVHHSG